MYNAIITKLGPIRDHSDADRLKLSTCWGNQIIVDLTAREGDWGVYFPTDGQLSLDFVTKNDLIRRKDANGNPAGGMFNENRRVRTQKLRGEISDGFWCPITLLEPIFGTVLINDGFITVAGSKFEHGHELNEIDNIVFCEKYVTLNTRQQGTSNRGKKDKIQIESKMFKEHFDTNQFGANLHKIPVDSLLIITEKEHGTSGRYGYVQINRKLSWLEKIALKLKVNVQKMEWINLNGSRRTISNPFKITTINKINFRDTAIAPFKNNLHKGETIYFEIVGWEGEGRTIMSSVDNRKLNDKDFVKKYGEVTTFSYGCEPGTFDIAVYRITMTNVDGFTYDLCWEDVKTRSTELGVRHVHQIDMFIVNERFKYLNDENEMRKRLFDYVQELVSGPSTIDPRHIKEGVCVRIENNLHSLKVFKHKSFEFKVLEGIIKDSGVADMEESE
jgi:hypothetical protein